ncbi:MAG: DNA translocase FtsK 4TM domain-containing protein, partial [Thermodesulfobacteriota bacterium]|nr:DNA translocase FtsK 4TM domain-containing protein [Thermodesulfobacteriota bacterium]
MRKEIFGILLLFILVLTTISLLSYHPTDPSINTQTSGEIQNLFGLLGAHIAGFCIALFGLGAFWVPVVLLVMAFHVFLGSPRIVILVALVGGGLLVITTGSLLSLGNTHYLLLGKRFSSGGIVGIAFATIVKDYISTTGGLIFLFTLWAVGFVMTTRLSFLGILRGLTALCKRGWGHGKSLWVVFRERRHKAKKRAKTRQKLPQEPKAPVKIVQPVARAAKETPAFRQEAFGFVAGDRGFRLPSLNILKESSADMKAADHEALQMQSRLLEKKLSDFDVSGKVLAVSPGPVVTMYEYEPAPGVKINKIVNLTDDLALALRAESIRIVAPIPGKSVIGIEVPNQ